MDKFDAVVTIGAIALTVLIGFGFEYYVYSTGQLQEHMTFLEFLLITGRGR